MSLPSPIGGAVTSQVGFLHNSATRVARWFIEGLSREWVLSRAGWQSFDDAIVALKPSVSMSTYAFIDIDDWTLLLSNGPLGTDVGMIPSLVARELHIRGIRAVCVDDGASPFAARILEVFGPDGEPPLLIERMIAAANDGGRWVFETSGTPFPFEDQTQYRHRIKAKRFTSAMLHDYLRRLDVPVDSEPDWVNARIVQPAGVAE